MAPEKAAPEAVVVEPQAFVSIALHAIQYPNDSVHGILVGSFIPTTSTVVIEDAVPVSHGAPTKPLAEMALGLFECSNKKNEGSSVVGWYTAPMLKEDAHAGPVALRMAASLASSSSSSAASMDPVLVVVQNKALGDLIKNNSTGKVPDVLKAFGRDFGKQWLEPLKVTVEDSAKAGRAAREAASQKVEVVDFVDHLEKKAASSWYPNKDIQLIVSKC